MNVDLQEMASHGAEGEREQYEDERGKQKGSELHHVLELNAERAMTIHQHSRNNPYRDIPTQPCPNHIEPTQNLPKQTTNPRSRPYNIQTIPIRVILPRWMITQPNKIMTVTNDTEMSPDPHTPKITYLPDQTTQSPPSATTKPIHDYIVENPPDTPPTSPTLAKTNQASRLSSYLDKMTLKRTREEMENQPEVKRRRQEEAESKGVGNETRLRARVSPRTRGGKTSRMRRD